MTAFQQARKWATAASHGATLLKIVEDATREVGAISPDLKKTWETRYRQIVEGLIADEATQRWLTNHADYWQPKDRFYADYVRSLAASYRPAIDFYTTLAE